jgi:hypothetical protein
MINHNPNNVESGKWAMLDNNTKNIVWVISMTPNKLISTVSRHPSESLKKTWDVMTDRLKLISPLRAAFQK